MHARSLTTWHIGDDFSSTTWISCRVDPRVEIDFDPFVSIHHVSPHACSSARPARYLLGFGSIASTQKCRRHAIGHPSSNQGRVPIIHMDHLPIDKPSTQCISTQNQLTTLFILVVVVQTQRLAPSIWHAISQCCRQTHGIRGCQNGSWTNVGQDTSTGQSNVSLGN